MDGCKGRSSSRKEKEALIENDVHLQCKQIDAQLNGHCVGPHGIKSSCFADPLIDQSGRDMVEMDDWVQQPQDIKIRYSNACTCPMVIIMLSCPGAR